MSQSKQTENYGRKAINKKVTTNVHYFIEYSCRGCGNGSDRPGIGFGHSYGFVHRNPTQDIHQKGRWFRFGENSLIVDERNGWENAICDNR